MAEHHGQRDDTHEKSLALSVECYAGHRAEETPRALIIGDRRVTVVEVVDRWLAPDHRYFKVRGDDGDVYIIRRNDAADEWELTMFVRGQGPARERG